MKKMYNYLKLLPILLLGFNWNAAAQTTAFSYTGTMATYTVPNGVTYVVIDAEGAKGGYNLFGSSFGANGALLTCTMTVTPLQILYVSVGGQGSTSSPGGFGGGGATTSWGGSGGGASDIRTGGITLADRVVVAGGGGG